MTNKQNAHLTFKGNIGVSRHDWLRLTPAYSYRLVSHTLNNYLHNGINIVDPFAGTGTTGLVAAELGLTALLLDINPFLVWFGQIKTSNYSASDIQTTRDRASMLIKLASDYSEADLLDPPPIHNIERWWSNRSLQGLMRLKTALNSIYDSSPSDELLKVAFCRVMILSSNASFNHQSMSFKTSSRLQLPLFSTTPDDEIMRLYDVEVDTVLSSASIQLPGKVKVVLEDARVMQSIQSNTIDLIYTSPPYANRMSYIRELRPYMYWLDFLRNQKDAGELDWQAIGGTWGIATSRLPDWHSGEKIPLSPRFLNTLHCISTNDAPNARLLSKYVEKYFSDIFIHLREAYKALRPGGRVIYIVGNSTFYGTLVPTEQWYAELLATLGFVDVSVEKLRKRNSKKELFEFKVSATKPLR